jgi:hypothetical protein
LFCFCFPFPVWILLVERKGLKESNSFISNPVQQLENLLITPFFLGFYKKIKLSVGIDNLYKTDKRPGRDFLNQIGRRGMQHQHLLSNIKVMARSGLITGFLASLQD